MPYLAQNDGVWYSLTYFKINYLTAEHKRLESSTPGSTTARPNQLKNFKIKLSKISFFFLAFGGIFDP